MNRTLKNALVLSLALLLLFSFGACGGSGGDTYKGESASSSVSQSGNQSADIDMPESEAGFDGEGETGSIEVVRPQDRKLITTVNIQAETRDYDGFMSWLETRVAGAGGYIETSDMYAYSERERSCDLTLRVPADKLNGFLQEMGESCNILQRSVAEEDVTLNYVDAESYRDALLVEQERLMELLEKADNLTDIMSIEDRLTTVRYQLQNYESTLRVYDNPTNYSTVHLSIHEVGELTEPEPESWGSRAIQGMKENARSIGRFFQELGLFIVTHIPTLLLLGVVALIILLATARHRREARIRRKQQKELIQAMREKKGSESQKPEE